MRQSVCNKQYAVPICRSTFPMYYLINIFKNRQETLLLLVLYHYINRQGKKIWLLSYTNKF